MVAPTWLLASFPGFTEGAAVCATKHQVHVCVCMSQSDRPISRSTGDVWLMVKAVATSIAVVPGPKWTTQLPVPVWNKFGFLGRCSLARGKTYIVLFYGPFLFPPLPVPTSSAQTPPPNPSHLPLWQGTV